MVRAKEYCEKTTSYLWNGEEKSTLLVLELLFFSPQLLSLRRCSYRFFAAQRTHRKKLMSAGFTAQRWNTQQPS